MNPNRHPNDTDDDLPPQPAGLRHCPFCAAPATLDHNLTNTGFFVSCTNDACLYGPEPGRDFVSVEAAVSAWQGQA